MTAVPGLVGRAIERGLLREHLARTREGTSAVLVTGPAGIGKSALADRLTRECRLGGGRVGWAVAGEWAGASPFWPWAEALSQLGVATDRLLRPGDDTTALEDGTARAEAFASVARGLTEASRTGPVMVVLEDLHQADTTTLELFGYLATRPGPGPVLLLATARPGRAEVDELRVDRVEVPPWTREEVAEAAVGRGRALDPEALATLHARTGGNPLFVLRLLERPDMAAAPVPADVRTLLVDQVAALPEPTRQVVDALAVLGSGVGPDLLAEVAGRDLTAALEPAVVAGLVHGDDDAVRFDHELTRDAVYATLAAARRSALHEAAAVSLSRLVADPGVIAHHYARAARAELGRPAAVLARSAGVSALRAGALPEAVRYHEQARAALALTDDRADELDFVLDHVRALSFARRMADAERTLLDAEALATTEDERCRLVAEYGRLRWREEPNATVLHAEELARLADAWFATSDRDEVVVVRETARVAAAEIGGITAATLTAANAALAAARRTGSDQLQAEAHLARRRALMVHHCSLEERRVDSGAALPAAERSGDGELAGRARRMAVADAMAAGDRIAAVALMAPPPGSASTALIEHRVLWGAGMAALEGRYDDAARLLAEARERLEERGIHSMVLEYMATAYAWDTGQLTTFLARYEPVLATIEDPTVRAGSALAALLDGHPDVAQRHLDVALAALLRPEITPLWLVGAAVAAEVAAALDDPRVGALHDLLATYAGQCVVPAAAAAPFLGSVDRVLGLLCLRRKEHDEAEAHLRAALRIDRSMRARPWEARTHAALALALDARDAPAEAEAHRAEAARLQADLGMGDVLLLGAPRSGPEGARPAPAGPGHAWLRATGDHWEVGLDGVGGSVAPLVGLDHIARLVRDGGRDWHVLDLAGTPGSPRSGHGGEVLDDTARAAYRRRYEELSADLDEAHARTDPGSAERAQLELDQLETQLLTAYGLGGRSRTIDDPTERMRINVQRAISRAIVRVGSVSPPLADHLRHRLHTGRFCRYQPDPSRPVEWEL